MCHYFLVSFLFIENMHLEKEDTWKERYVRYVVCMSILHYFVVDLYYVKNLHPARQTKIDRTEPRKTDQSFLRVMGESKRKRKKKTKKKGRLSKGKWFNSNNPKQRLLFLPLPASSATGGLLVYHVQFMTFCLVSSHIFITFLPCPLPDSIIKHLSLLL